MYFKNMLEGYCVGLRNFVQFVIEPAPEHSMDFIINRLRKQDPTKSSKLSFVVEADLHNIVQRFNMIPGWRHKDDVTSLQMRHEENNVDDGIRCFELPQDSSGRGFLLVIITPLMADWIRKYSGKGVSLDDTFNTTRYSLRLATLMVMDEKDRGLPVDILAYLHGMNQKAMAEYLEKNYLGRTPTWASFANRGAVLDTTMISERFHLRIKDEFLHRNSNSRVDSFVDLLVKAVEDISESLEVKKNTHCLNCGVCAYAWSCTCMDNRTGVSCPHKHAVKLLTPECLPSECVQENAPDFVVEMDTPVVEAQERKEARYQKLNAIRSTYAAIDAKASLLAKLDTDEAMAPLQDILNRMQSTAGTIETSSNTLAPRPELNGIGGKPQLTKIQLHQEEKLHKFVHMISSRGNAASFRTPIEGICMRSTARELLEVKRSTKHIYSSSHSSNCSFVISTNMW
ncbi:hypothetical protein COOONC_10262 [Cooperia oncophora]